MSDDETAASDRYRAAMAKLGRDLVDQGLLIEAGWVSCRRMVLPRDAPGHQIDTCRAMFFAGAQHLWGSVMGILDPGAEPTDDDMRRMSRIDAELQTFLEQFAERHKIELPEQLRPRPRGKPS